MFRVGGGFTFVPKQSQNSITTNFRRWVTTENGEKLFDKILIANRGEIACRVMRTCKKLGIKTVAVYSEADAKSVHAATADEAICIGPAPTNQSYLRVDKIIEAIKMTGAQAVHPGYGFLSENFHFVEELDKIGCTFIGPNVKAMQEMGDKIESKKIAKNAGVNIIPGFLGEVTDKDHLLSIANSIGYPVMIKASAGGGGKGMRIAWNDKEAIEGFEISKREALSSFGDDRMLIEKFVTKPRHIEIQVLADGKGNALYLNERECSIQRRNQKVTEEAPSPFLTPEVRKMMGEQAVALANAVGYNSAGTVEMLVDPDRNFYFLEMNTRLQVEHPITEYTTGFDIVEEMIRIAAGYPIRQKQEDVKINGWAIESRVYAENPLRSFLPSIGTLTTYVEPPKSKDIRIDTGVTEGSEISIYYDPLIAKLVTHGANRTEAIQNMIYALDNYRIDGVTHNINFLRSVMTHPRFIAGNTQTSFIPEEYPSGFVVSFNEKQMLELVVGTALKYFDLATRNTLISEQLPSCEDKDNVDLQSLVVSYEDKSFNVNIIPGEESSIVVVNGVEYTVDYQYNASAKSYTVQFANESQPVTFQFFKQNYNGVTVQHCGFHVHVKVQTQKQLSLESILPPPKVQDLSKFLKSPMPGKIVSISVKNGDKVYEGQIVMVLEAMKMQNILRAEKDTVVKSVNFKAGDNVPVDCCIIEYE